MSDYNLQKIKKEIPALEANKEGLLRGGFSTFGVQLYSGSDNKSCDSNNVCFNNRGTCNFNKSCYKNGQCLNNDSCENNTVAIANYDHPCNNNGTCTNSICKPDKDKDTESEGSSFLMLGSSALF